MDPAPAPSAFPPPPPGRDQTASILPKIALDYRVYYLVCFWVEAVLYGIYFCLFVASLNILRRRDQSTFASRFFLAGILAMFVLITYDNALNVHRMIQGYAYELNPFGVLGYMGDNQNWEAFTFLIILALLTWIGDIMVIFRCFLIWDSKFYVIAVPSLLLLASIVITGVNLWWFANPFNTVLLFEDVLPLLNTTFPLNLSQNILTTGLIIYKIIDQYRLSRRAGIISSAGLNLINVVRIIIESASIYTIQMFLLTVLFAVGHPSMVIVQHALVPSTGIVFVLMSIRTYASRSTSTVFVTEQSPRTYFPSWLNEDEHHNHSGQIQRRDSDTRRLSRATHIPFVTTAIEQHHLERMSMPNKDSDSTCKV